MEETKKTRKAQDLMVGVAVFGVLALLTLIEYFLGVAQAPAPLLWAIALMKGGLVLWFFMNIKRLFAEDGGH